MFNLEDFKKYGRAVRRDGQLVRFIAHVPDALLEHERLVCMDAQARLFPSREDGKASSLCHETKYDLVDVVHPMRNVSFTVPEPLTTMPVPGDVVYAVIGNLSEIHVIEIIWGGPPLNTWGKTILAHFKMGLVYKTAEDAETAAAAIRKGFGL